MEQQLQKSFMKIRPDIDQEEMNGIIESAQEAIEQYLDDVQQEIDDQIERKTSSKQRKSQNYFIQEQLERKSISIRLSIDQIGLQNKNLKLSIDEGYLEKKVKKKWIKYYFRIMKGRIYQYQDVKSYNSLFKYELLNFSDCVAHDEKPNQFFIEEENTDKSFQKIKLRAQNFDERNLWVVSILGFMQQVIENNLAKKISDIGDDIMHLKDYDIQENKAGNKRNQLTSIQNKLKQSQSTDLQNNDHSITIENSIEQKKDDEIITKSKSGSQESKFRFSINRGNTMAWNNHFSHDVIKKKSSLYIILQSCCSCFFKQDDQKIPLIESNKQNQDQLMKS